MRKILAMTSVFIPHRIPPQDRLARILKAGIASPADVESAILANLSGHTVDMEQVIVDVIGDNDPPWVENISGKLQLAIEDDGGEATGDIVELVVTDGVVEVPDEHLAHVLAGVHGAYVMES